MLNLSIISFLIFLVFLIHLAYIAFALFGGFIVLWRRWTAWLHVPAVVWAMLIMFINLPCPLTKWEKILRAKARLPVYDGGFIQHYLKLNISGPWVYAGSILIVAVNIFAYWRVLKNQIKQNFNTSKY
jgi:hypothetical protein